MADQRFSGAHIDAVVFDVIGTLVDEETAFLRAAESFVPVVHAGGAEQLQRRWADSLDEKMSGVVNGTDVWRPHRDLVVQSGRDVLAGMAAVLTPGLDRILEGVDVSYDAWPDVAPAIRALRDGRLVVGFSNGDLSSLARLALRNDLAWHTGLSTGEIHTFKPADAAYQFVIDKLELDPARTLFVAAHTWDLVAAAKFGFRTAWVERKNATRPQPADRIDIALADLSELAGVLTGHATDR